MSITDSDGKPGLRIESAASITLHDTLQKHMGVFAHVIRTDKAASTSTVGVYISGLAGAVALGIAGGLGDRADVIETTIKTLRDAIERDLKHLGGAT